MTMRDEVLTALDMELPRSRDELMADTRLDQKQVDNCLHQLKAAGKAARRKDGWVRLVSVGESLASHLRGDPDPIPRLSEPDAYEPPNERPIVASDRVASTFFISDQGAVRIEQGDATILLEPSDALRLNDFIGALRKFYEPKP